MNAALSSNLILSDMTDSSILSLSAYTISQLPGIVAFTKTHESIYIGATPYCANLFGLKDPHHIFGLNDFELKTPTVESAENFRNEDKKIFANNDPSTFFQINICADGKRHFFLSQKIPVNNYHGKVIGLNCVANEITNPCVTKTIMYLLSSNKFFINCKETSFNLMVDDGHLFNELTVFENEVLYLFNIGFSQKDIGFMANISLREITKCLESIRFKLKCTYHDLNNLCLKKNFHEIIPKSLLDRIFSQLMLPNKKFESIESNTPIYSELSKYKFIDKQKNSSLKLTQQQSQCLYYLLQGKGIKEIALEVQLSSRTVEHYISDIRKKNGYDSIKQLLVNVYFNPFA